MSKMDAFERRRKRNAFRVKVNNRGGRPILNVFRSNKNIYAQLVDVKSGNVLLSVSSKSKELAEKLVSKTGLETATEIGSLVAKKAREANIFEVVFNKGPYLYSGRVKALAEAARAGGLEF